MGVRFSTLQRPVLGRPTDPLGSFAAVGKSAQGIVAADHIRISEVAGATSATRVNGRARRESITVDAHPALAWWLIGSLAG